jgi:hypothetical protein
MTTTELIQRLQCLPGDYKISLVFPDVCSMSSCLDAEDGLRIDAAVATIYIVAEDSAIPSDDGKTYGHPAGKQEVR